MLTACYPRAPEVHYTLMDGRQADLSTLHGKVVLVNFWSTDCAPCVEEMPGLAHTYARYAPQGFETLAVSMREDPPLAVIRFAQSRRLPFPVVMDQTGDFAARFDGVEFTPTSVLIDRQGRIVARWVGQLDMPRLEMTLERLLDAR